MKALRAQSLSGPEGLAYTDVDDPAADAGVVIDVGAAGVCFPDLLMLRGEYQLKLDPPFIPGVEVAGTVRSAPEGSGFAVGQRVSAFSPLGAWAERAVVPADSVVPTADGLDDGGVELKRAIDLQVGSGFLGDLHTFGDGLDILTGTGGAGGVGQHGDLGLDAELGGGAGRGRSRRRALRLSGEYL